MNMIRAGGPMSSAAGICGSLVLLTLFAGSARGQYAPQMPDPHWGPQQLNPGERVKAAVDSQRAHAQAEVRKETDRQWRNLWPDILAEHGARLVLIGAVLVMALAGWLYFRLFVTTDPERLARSDPWVRRHMAQADAEQAASGASEGGPDKEVSAPPTR